jgi:hypothetical protein
MVMKSEGGKTAVLEGLNGAVSGSFVSPEGIA